MCSRFPVSLPLLTGLCSSAQFVIEIPADGLSVRVVLSRVFIASCICLVVARMSLEDVFAEKATFQK